MSETCATRPLNSVLTMVVAGALSSLPGAAQEGGLRFNAPPLTLPQPIVTTFLQDRHGFMWIGTQGGLVRYDGHGTQVYKGARGDHQGLPSNSVRALMEHSDGRIWVATLGGLGVLNVERDTVVALTREDRPDLFPTTDVLNALAELPGGRVVVGTDGGGIVILDADLRGGEVYTHSRGDPTTLPNNAAEAVVVVDDGTLWVATLAGVAYKRMADSVFRSAPLPAPRRDLGDQPRRLAMGADGVVWVGGLDGVVRFDPRSGTSRRTGLATGRVQSMVAVGSDTLWVGTYGGGLHLLDGEGRLVEEFPPGDGRPQTLLDGRVSALTVDRSGLLWVGLWGRGVQTADPGGGAFGFLGGGLELDGDEVTSIGRMPAGDVLLTTYDGGVHVLRSDGTVRRRVGARFGLGRPVETLAALGLESGEILIGTMRSGLIQTNVRGASRVYRNDEADSLSAPPATVYGIARDSAGGIWVGTTLGLRKMDLTSATFTLPIEGDGRETLRTAFVRGLHVGGDGTLWVATLGSGLMAVDPARGSMEVINPERFAGIPDDEVSAVTTAGGYAWFGTRSAGTLHRVSNWGTDGRTTVELIGPTDGLGSAVQCMTPDASGTLWASTSFSIVRIDPMSLTTTIYGAANGLPAGEFRSGSCTLAPDGRVWFGQQTGVTVFHPDSVPTPTLSARAVVSAASFGGRQALAPFGPTLRAIPWREHLITFNLALLEYRNPATQTFSYRLNTGPWIELGREATVAFANLAPGTYQFEARGRDAHGFLAEPSEPLTFDVVPPFYMTTWFRLLAAILLGGVMVGLYQWRTRTIRRHNVALRREMRARERLEAEGAELEEQLRHAQKMEAVGRLTGGIAHDFNNILTVLMGNAELLMETSVAPDDRALAEEIRESGQRAAKLVSQLLVFSRKQPLTPESTSLTGLLERIAPMLRRTLGERTEVVLDLPDDPGVVVLDENQMEAAVLNLAINARDAMPDGGVLTLWLEKVLADRDDAGLPTGTWWRLSVTDTGTGIEPDVMDRIFEPFFTTKSVGQGSGLGLSMVYGFLEESGGHLRVVSEPGVGSEFRLYLPPG